MCRAVSSTDGLVKKKTLKKSLNVSFALEKRRFMASQSVSFL